MWLFQNCSFVVEYGIIQWKYNGYNKQYYNEYYDFKEYDWWETVNQSMLLKYYKDDLKLFKQ